MKKPYLKPELYAESFRLVEHISAICAETAGKANSVDALTCTYDADQDLGLFYKGMEDSPCYSPNSPKYSALAEEDPFIMCYLGLFNGNEIKAFASS